MGIIVNLEENLHINDDSPFKELYDRVQAVLDRAPEHQEALLNYVGCKDEIKNFINVASEENRVAVTDKLSPAISMLREFYDFALELEQVAPDLLNCLCSKGNDSLSVGVNQQKAIAAQFFNFLFYIMRFDDIRMKNSDIPNDFAFYRRSRNNSAIMESLPTVPEDVANKMCLFFAYPSPLMKMMTKLLEEEIETINLPKQEVIDGLSLMANVCLRMVEEKRFTNEQSNVLCLTAMTAAIVIVDHVYEKGVFCRGTPINIKKAIVTLNTYKENVDPMAEGLLNALRYSTQHINDQDTPSGIRNLLGLV
jgi:Holliday junction resolvasome RuvABC endonuclease subunit